MSQVWECQVTHREQALLLALCDHADDQGRNVFPSVEYLEWKTDFDERTIQRVMSSLRTRGVLIVERKAGYKRPTNYRIDLSVLPRKKAFERKGDKRSPYIQYADEHADTRKGDNMPPTDEPVVPDSSQMGDISVEMGVKKVDEGDKIAEMGDTAVSHESSLNHQSISIESSVVFSKEKIQTEIKSKFHVPFDFNWAWFDSLFSEIPDEALHLETAQRLFDIGTPHSQFDHIAYTRFLRAAYGRKESTVFSKGRKMPPRLQSKKAEATA